MPPHPPLAGILLLLFSSASSVAWAQTPTQLHAEHRDGQTFLTWNELSASGVSYRVYRAHAPLLAAESLAGAQLLGTVDDASSDNRGRSFATQSPHNWVITPGGQELSDDQGLFVHTVAEAGAGTPSHLARLAYYAVTTVENGVENTSLVPGANATSAPVAEWAAPPQPVLQTMPGDAELWAHWVGDLETPFQPALSINPSHGFNFLFQPGSSPGPRGLVVRLHSAGQTYAQGWPGRHEVPNDVDILALSDLFQGPGFTLWFGIREDYGSPSSPDARVRLFTIKRALWTIDWMQERLGSAHDPERLYAIGGSMGAMGSYYLATQAPARFAAVLCRAANFDLTANDLGNPGFIQSLLGSYADDLQVAPEDLPPYATSLSVFERANGAFMAQLAPEVDFPVVRTINGRNDTTVGWQSAAALYASMGSARRPSVHYFDERPHGGMGYWTPLQARLLQRTFATRRDRPMLRFDELSLDEEAGTGNPAEGDPVGALGAYVDHEPAVAFADAETCRFEVFLRAEGALDDAGEPSATVRLSPHRSGAFAPEPGELVLVYVTEGTLLRHSELVHADADGTVRTGPVEVTTGPRRVTFLRIPGSPTVPGPVVAPPADGGIWTF